MTLARAALWTADSVFALRPLLWIPAVALYAAGGAVQAGGAPREGGVLPSLLLILGGVHLANSWRDARSDRANRKGWAITSGVVGPGRLVLLCVLSVALAAWLASRVEPGARALLLLAALLGAAYVAPGLELKRRSGWDVAANGVGYGVIAFLLGAAIPPGRVGAAALAALPYACGVASVSLATMIADLRGDEEVGQRTTAVTLGARGAANAAILLAWASALLGFLLRDPVPALWGVLSGGWLGLAANRLEDQASWNRAAIAMQVAFLAVLAARAWFPLVFAVAVGGSAALYNRARFGAGYPLTAG